MKIPTPVIHNNLAIGKITRLYNALKVPGYDQRLLKVYLLRLLFGFFAEGAGFIPRGSWGAYLAKSRPDGADLGERIGQLFEFINLSDHILSGDNLSNSRPTQKTPDAAALRPFRHLNWALFSDILPLADFDATTRNKLLDCRQINWNGLSPTIMGSLFQGSVEKTHRHAMGAHYASEANILKLIKPLFLDGLWAEFELVKTNEAALKKFHHKISHLKFLDPACVRGLFLIIAYRETRLLELENIKFSATVDQKMGPIAPLLKVSTRHFYGLELEKSPELIAQMGLWLMESQMSFRVAETFGLDLTISPVLKISTIRRANALTIDWVDVVPKSELSYILGNPPFLGSKAQTKEQRQPIAQLAVDNQGTPFNQGGILDYVAGWFFRSAQMTRDTRIPAAFVSTSSIVQGERVAALWRPLMEQFPLRTP
ncbi:MAG: hypothetical protein LBT86_10415 [Deltaproteobacteria bacterium]|jgi:hypothetical protein|nr:hypothetical protein [Deltaproteobacteria bacterium]